MISLFYIYIYTELLNGIVYNVTKAFYFKINADLWIFQFIKESLEKNYLAVLNVDDNNNNNNNNNNNKMFLEQHIRMISGGSCD